MSGETPSRETRRVELAQRGDREALDRPLRSTQGWLQRHLLRLTGDPVLALQTLQEVLLAVCRHLTFLHGPRLYRPRVCRIASRRAFGRLRRHRRLREMELPPTGLIHGTLRLGSVALGAYIRYRILQAVRALAPPAS